MKTIRIHITQIKGHLYAKIPSIIAEKYDIKHNDDLEISIHRKNDVFQEEIWNLHPEDITNITYNINDEVHTMNMYNRIYVPEKYRFFFPVDNVDFILITNVGNIKTHLTVNGYISKGLRQWFHANGPIMPGDVIDIVMVNDELREYELIYRKSK